MARKEGFSVDATGAAPLAVAADALALPVFEEDLRGGHGPLRALDAQLGGALLAAARAERFEGKPREELQLPTLGRATCARVLLLGLGKRDGALAGLRREGYEPLRMAAGQAARTAAKAGARSLAVALPDGTSGEVPAAARAAAEGALLGSYA